MTDLREMTDQEVRSPIGFLKIDDGPIQLGYDNLPLEQVNYGIDVFSDKPIVIRATESIDYARDDPEKIINLELKALTFVVVRWLEHNRIPGEIVLYYEMAQLGWDYKFICKAYKRRIQHAPL